MKVADVMVSNVITVGVNASIGEVAAILLNNNISGAPVVGEKGELVGIVSEGDLIRRPETGTSEHDIPGGSSFCRMNVRLPLSTSNRTRGKVADVMTCDVITAKPDTPLGDVARLLERNRIKRVPIVEGAKLVGIVSRANILQALASAAKKLPSLTTTDDSQLRKKVVSRFGFRAVAADHADRHGSRRHRRPLGPCPLGRAEESSPTRCRNHAWRPRRR